MANQTKDTYQISANTQRNARKYRFRLSSSGRSKMLRSILLFAICLMHLSAYAVSTFGQTNRVGDASSGSSSAFNTPPSFERIPTRVPSRGSSLNGISSNRQTDFGNQSTTDASLTNQLGSTFPSEDEWIPKNLPSQSSPFQSPQHPTTNHVPQQGFAPASAQDVQQASYTVSASTEFAPVRTASVAAKGASSSIPLKPPSAETVSLAPSKSRSNWTSIVSMICSLLLVIAIFLGLSWMFRKTSAISGAMLPKEVVEIIGRTPMANRQQLYVIRFGRKLVLVSQQIGQTEVLSEIDDRTEVDHLLGLCEQSNSKGVATSFRNVLQQVATTTESKWAIRQKRNADRVLPGSVTTSFDTHS